MTPGRWLACENRSKADLISGELGTRISNYPSGLAHQSRRGGVHTARTQTDHRL